MKIGKVIERRRPLGLTIGKVILLGGLSLLFILLTAAWIFLNVYKPEIDPLLLDAPELNQWDMFLADADMEGAEHPLGADLKDMIEMDRNPGDIYNFLILGRDEGLLTDVMMIMTFNVKESKIAILSIPRDSYINLAGIHQGKINSVFARGFNTGIRAGKTSAEATVEGIDFLRRIINVTFGVPIDRYFFIDLRGVNALVDAVGGVEVNVPFDMKYSDRFQKPPLNINLTAGLQTLNGAEAEQFIRFRNATGDIGRIDRQKTFLAALTKKMLKFDVAQIRRIFEITEEHVTTNLTAANIGWFAVRALDVKLEDIITHTVPGEPVWVGRASCWAIYKPETIELINRHYNPFVDEIPESNFNIFVGDGWRAYAHLTDTSGATMDELAN
jgi:LCP family protein required for cell wall assembly